MSLVLLGLVVLAAASLVHSTLTLGIGPLPTSRAVRAAMVSLCPPELEGTAYELGSGWGGLARAVARRCPKANVIGVEAAWLPWAFSALVQAVAPLPNLRLVRGDFAAQPLSDGSLWVSYLYTQAMQSLSLTLRPKPGALLVSSTFALPNHTPQDVLQAADLYRSKVYRYRW